MGKKISIKHNPFLTDEGQHLSYKESWRYDLPASLVIFLLAIPLCLGIALASGAPLFAGLIAGVVGGIVVTSLSGSALGVTGPSAGLAVIVYAAIQDLGFETVLLAVVLAGILQFILGNIGAGVIGYYFPSAVITGMLSGIGIIIFLKQIPHALGYDSDYEGNMSFAFADIYPFFTDTGGVFDSIAPGAVIISLVCLGFLFVWETTWIKQFAFRQWIRGTVVAVTLGVILNQLFILFYPEWALGSEHLVVLPVIHSFADLNHLFSFPDFSQIDNPKLYPVVITIAVVASLESLLCVEATDKLDPYKRITSNNRELRAQGIGNICSGLIGGLPMTQLIIRSSASIQAGGRTRMAAFVQGILLLIAVLLLPNLANKIPLASLAAILFIIAYRLAKPVLFKQMYQVGWSHFIPFMATILGLVFLDMLIGIGVGMAFALFFILLENFNMGMHVREQPHINKTIITLPENVSFLHKSNILHLLSNLPNKANIVIDATYARFVDYDVHEVIENFKVDAVYKEINLVIQNWRGFGLLPHVKRALPITQEEQQAITPDEVLELLKIGNMRFVNSLRDKRNLLEQADESASGQFPTAIILSCIDSRTAAELIFDQGFGDVFSVRVAGNVVNKDILGSMEFACKLAGSKLIVVLGHTHCGAIKGACAGAELGHLTGLLNKIQPAVKSVKQGELAKNSHAEDSLFDKVAGRNVELMVEKIKRDSELLRELEASGEIGIVSAVHNIETGRVEF
ncbi:MAG: carbonic anhydrase [Methyloprofundus sp.]|nr:carbonic anhydrase [Methyloprofundus sp.]